MFIDPNIDNDDFCRFLVVASISRRMSADEKVIIFRGAPMVVKKSWHERLFTRIARRVNVLSAGRV